MASHKYEIREICGDWTLDIHWGKETITLFFNSRNNAELVKSILEWEDTHPNAVVPYNPTLTQPNEPLTIEQLREMDGEPVYDAKDKKWHFIETVCDCFVEMTDGAIFDSGIWCDNLTDRLYRFPPEGEKK